MKLLFLLVVILSFQANAGSYAQTINLKVTSAPLETVLKEIRKQSGYGLLYTSPVLDNTHPVTLSLDNTPLTDALEKIFAGQSFTYTIKDKNIVVSPLNQVQLKVKPIAPALTVKGTISDEKGEPLPGATITLKGTQTATFADANGNFTLTVPDGTGTLVITFQGYAAQEIAVNGRQTLDVKMVPEVNKLNEVVVLGYSTVLKKDLTGAVSTLTPDQITRVQSNNLVQSLVGVPGVRVNSGASGVDDIRIRGNRSVRAANAPTIIVDGMPYYGSLNTIDQYDIASINILKDASSAALYGSKGANGVIVITTKKGVKGQSAVTFDHFSGVNVYLPGNLQPMNAAQYIQFKRDANQAVGLWASPADDPKIFTALEIEGFGKVDNDAAKQFYKKLGFQTNSTVTVLNGGEKGTQKISFNFYNNNGRGENMDNSNRFLLSANIDHQVIRKLKVGVSSRLSYEFQQNAPGSFVNGLFRYPPTVKYYDDQGNLIITPIGDPNMRNPYLDLNRDYMDSQSKAWEYLLKGMPAILSPRI